MLFYNMEKPELTIEKPQGVEDELLKMAGKAADYRLKMENIKPHSKEWSDLKHKLTEIEHKIAAHEEKHFGIPNREGHHKRKERAA